MTNAQALSLMMGRLGGRTAATLRTTLLLELNNKIRELERGDVKPWFLEELEEEATIANQNYVNHPASFLEETEDGTFEIQNSEGAWVPLVKVTREKLRAETRNELPALPEGYAIWGNKFLLGPTPDAVYNYRFDYYKRTTAVVDTTAEIENSWLLEFFEYTSTEALIIVAAQHIQSSEVVQKISMNRSRLYDQFLKAVAQREIARRTLLITDEES